jgi:nucleotide-binding universal stress UspA family protein
LSNAQVALSINCYFGVATRCVLYKHIVIPTDGSDISNAAALAGIEFAEEFNAEILGIFVAPRIIIAAAN